MLVYNHKNLVEPRSLIRIMLDLDGSIFHTPYFFKDFTKLFFPISEIHITACQKESNIENIKKELEDMGVLYHRLVLNCNKPFYIKNEDINIVFSSVDEDIVGLPSNVICFKVREQFNFDWESMRWVYDKKTGVDIKEL